MRIVAALCWYREPPEFLTRCVESLAGIADRVVALDGRWANFPTEDISSTAEETNAIHNGPVDATVYNFHRVYGSQVEKRAILMELAAGYGDWILVIDGDEHISEADPAALRAGLAHTDAVVGEITLIQPEGIGGGLTRRLYRAGTTVEIVHTGYTYQGRHLLPGEPTVDLTDCLTITHDYRARGAQRNAQSDEYIRLRAETREETWVST